MHRAFALPVASAVVGALLAIGVSVADRVADRNHDRAHLVRAVELVDPADVEVDLAELERHMDEVIEGMGEIPIENRRLRAIATIGESSGITIRVGPSERGLKLDDAVRARIEAVSSGASTPR